MRGGQMCPPARQESYHAPVPARVAQGELSEQAGVAAAHALLARRLRQDTADVGRTLRRPPAGAGVPVGTIALFGFNFPPG